VRNFNLVSRLGGRIIGSGYNHDRVCINGQDVPSVHAEIDVLHDKTLKETKGMTLATIQVRHFFCLDPFVRRLTNSES
jgi:hypothetical protein